MHPAVCEPLARRPVQFARTDHEQANAGIDRLPDRQGPSSRHPQGWQARGREPAVSHAITIGDVLFVAGIVLAGIVAVGGLVLLIAIMNPFRSGH